MFQTNSSSSALGALGLDSAPKGRVDRAERTDNDNDRFSQEFDKQVKSTKPKEQAEETEKPREAKNDSETEEVEASGAEQEEGTEEVEASVVEQEEGGNNLPLEQMRKMVDEQEALNLKTDGIPMIPVDEAPVVDAEVNLEEVETDLLARKRGKGNDLLNAMMARQQKGTDMPMKGERGFDTLLNMSGRTVTTATSVDTLTPTLAPLTGQGATNGLATPMPVAMTLATPMQQANWGQAMAERVVWMTNANIQEAEIQLNPRELGPIGIKVTLNNDQANVSFVAQHATTREALEQAIPRLREMLNENGLQLGQSDVSDQGFKQKDGEPDEFAGMSGRGTRADGDADDELLEENVKTGVGYAVPSGVDAFA